MGVTYNTGTISVANGSDTVTGASTAWVDNVRPGWVLLHNTSVIGVVEAVVSDTEITLVRAYQGAAITTDPYDLISTGAVRAGLSEQVQTLIDAVQAQLDGPLAGLFGDGTLAEPGLAFKDDPDTGFYRPGSNRIAASKKLEAPEFGGDGVQSSATDTTAGRLARADYTYGPGNLIGTVSQSSGIPTGAVIESGGSGGSFYVRYADGTQICYARKFVALAINTAFMGGYISSNETWTFAAVFASTPSLFPAVENNSAFGAITTGAASTTSNTWAITSVSSATGVGRTVSLLAIGRWY